MTTKKKKKTTKKEKTSEEKAPKAANSKFDLSKVVDKARSSIKDEKRKKNIRKGSELKPISTDENDYVVLPPELDWEYATGLKGLPFGKLTQIAGRSDVGKTSFAVKAMKAAQEQGYGVLYVETEGKTAPSDLETWGVDSDNVLLAQSGIAEDVLDSMFRLWDSFFDLYPGHKLLVVIDSIGNTITQKDAEVDLTKDSIQPGQKGKTNRQGISKAIAKMQEDDVALLAMNYTYGNIGSQGRTNAGGEALHFFTYIGFQATRTGWVTAQKNGRKVRKGAKVKWKSYKNHAAKHLDRDLPEDVEYKITKKGFERI